MENKKLVVDFLQMVVAGKIDEAYAKYIDPKGKHHNAYYPAGFAALKQGMKESERQFPNKKFTVKNVFGDGDLVATHSQIFLGKQEISVVHMFKIKNDKIVEMWDVGQEVAAKSPNKDGAF